VLIVAVGNLTLATTETSSAAAPSRRRQLAVQGIGAISPASITQNGGWIGAGGVARLTTQGTATQNGGTVAAANTQITAATMEPRRSRVCGNIAVAQGSTVVSMVKSSRYADGTPGSVRRRCNCRRSPWDCAQHHLVVDVTPGITSSRDAECGLGRNKHLRQHDEGPGGVVTATC
jgi:hypothetical protein